MHSYKLPVLFSGKRPVRITTKTTTTLRRSPITIYNYSIMKFNTPKQTNNSISNNSNNRCPITCNCEYEWRVQVFTSTHTGTRTQYSPGQRVGESATRVTRECVCVSECLKRVKRMRTSGRWSRLVCADSKLVRRVQPK